MNRKTLLRLKMDLLKNQKKIAPFISTIKYSSNEKYKNQMFNSVINNELPGSKYIIKGILPKEFGELGSSNYILFQEGKLINELQWMKLLVSKYAREINIYLKYKKIYENHILNGEYKEANDLLTKIEGLICISIWGTTQRFLITELEKGIKEHKKTLSEISEKSKSSLVTFILEFFSFKVELNNNYQSLKYKIEKRFPNKIINFQAETLKEYLNFKLDINDIFKDENKIAKVLAMENTMSIIDIYESYIRAINLLIINDNVDLDLRKEIYIEVEELNNNSINDYRLDKILAFLSNNKIKFEYKKHCIMSRVLDEYTKGSYLKVIEIIETQELLKLGNLNIYDIYVKSKLFSNSKVNSINRGSLSEDILMLMEFIYRRIDIKNNLQEILNKALILSEFEISNQIIGFVNQFNKKACIQFQYLSEFNSEFYTPKSLEIYEKSANNIKYEFNNNNLFEVTLKVFNNNSDDISSDIDSLRKDFYEASSLIKKNINKSIYLFEKIYFNINKFNDGKKIYYTSKVCAILYYLYIQEKQYNKALNIIVDTYFFNKDSIYNIDLEKLKTNLEVFECEEIQSNINLVVYTYLLNSKDYDELYRVLANFTEKNKALLFSELFNNNKLNKLYKTQMNFICEKIYNLDVIKRFAFIEKNQIINERINTIRYLLSQGYNVNLLQEELNILVKEQIIKENIKKVDSSKIVADSKGILQELDGVYKSKFERFLELKDLDINVIYIDLSKASDESDNISTILTKAYEKQQQSYMLFKELVDEYINELLFNLNYGLDKFLSSRIRHGMLRDYLSKPFKNNNILNTKKDSSSVEYIFNQYVESRMENLDINIREKVILILAEFSEKIMNKIEQVEDWIRIKSDEDIWGMFDYSTIEKNMLSLYNQYIDINDYNIFYEKITDMFWKITEENLINIRKKFDDELYNYFRETLNDLEKKLRQLSLLKNYEILRDLQTKVGICSSILKQDLTLVRNWFQIKKDNQYVDFIFQDLISTCIEINKKLNRSYSNIATDVNIDLNVTFKGEKFTYWIDIINILYVNAIKHSGFKNIEDIKIKIESNIIDKKEIENKTLFNNIEDFNKFKELKNTFMMFSIENALSEDINEKEVENKVSEIFENMKNRNYSNYITMEGGTGIYKIDNILTNNIKSNYFYSFKCKENKFNITIILELNNELIVG